MAIEEIARQDAAGDEDALVREITSELQRAARVAARAEALIDEWETLVDIIDPRLFKHADQLLIFGRFVQRLKRELERPVQVS